MTIKTGKSEHKSKNTRKEIIKNYSRNTPKIPEKSEINVGYF